LDFGGSKIAAAVCGLDGNIRQQRVVPTEPSLGARANLDRALGLAIELLADPLADPLAERSHTAAELVAVGACTFGIPRTHGVELSPAIPGWDALPLRRRLEDAFGVPVELLTDVKAAASAEACAGALAGSDPGLYLNLGTGLAAAIVFGGVVIAGAHGASGEIGYNLRRSADVWVGDVPGPPMLEELVSGMGRSRGRQRDRGLPAARGARHR
jgi:glucokinase